MPPTARTRFAKWPGRHRPGYEYIAITDHTKNLAMTNGLDDNRALAHIAALRQVERELADEFYEEKRRQGAPFKPFVDLSGMNPSSREHQGAIQALRWLEWDEHLITRIPHPNLRRHRGRHSRPRRSRPLDEVLAQMDVLIASVHSLFNQPEAQMTERVLRALEILRAHPRPSYGTDAPPPRCLSTERAGDTPRRGSAGSSDGTHSDPIRLDLNDHHLRMAKEAGCKIVINTHSHHTSELDKIARNPPTPPRLADERRRPQHPASGRIRPACARNRTNPLLKSFRERQRTPAR